MAMLVWVKGNKRFLKIQEGTGDALTSDDIQDGMKDYVIWSTFIPKCLDGDDSLEMALGDSGVLMFREEVSAIKVLPECYESAFNKPYEKSDIVVLLQDD